MYNLYLKQHSPTTDYKVHEFEDGGLLTLTHISKIHVGSQSIYVCTTKYFAIDIGSPYHQLSLGVTPRRLMRKLYISVFTKKTFSDHLTVY